MSEGFAYIDILFFAMVAAFIALRLRSVLGRRTGHERRRSGGLGSARSNGATDNVVALPDRIGSHPRRPMLASPISADDSLKAGLTQIRLADQRFDLRGVPAGRARCLRDDRRGLQRGRQGCAPAACWPTTSSTVSPARSISASAAGQTLETQLIVDPREPRWSRPGCTTRRAHRRPLHQRAGQCRCATRRQRARGRSGDRRGRGRHLDL